MSSRIIPTLKPDAKSSPLNEAQILKLKFEAQNQRQHDASKSFILPQIRSYNDAKNFIENDNSELKLDLNKSQNDNGENLQKVSRSFSETTPTPPSDSIINCTTNSKNSTNTTNSSNNLINNSLNNCSNHKNKPSESFECFKTKVLHKVKQDLYYPYLGLENSYQVVGLKRPNIKNIKNDNKIDLISSDVSNQLKVEEKEITKTKEEKDKEITKEMQEENTIDEFLLEPTLNILSSSSLKILNVDEKNDDSINKTVEIENIKKEDTLEQLILQTTTEDISLVKKDELDINETKKKQEIKVNETENQEIKQIQNNDLVKALDFFDNVSNIQTENQLTDCFESLNSNQNNDLLYHELFMSNNIINNENFINQEITQELLTNKDLTNEDLNIKLSENNLLNDCFSLAMEGECIQSLPEIDDTQLPIINDCNATKLDEPNLTLKAKRSNSSRAGNKKNNGSKGVKISRQEKNASLIPTPIENFVEHQNLSQVNQLNINQLNLNQQNIKSQLLNQNIQNQNFINGLQIQLQENFQNIDKTCDNYDRILLSQQFNNEVLQNQQPSQLQVFLNKISHLFRNDINGQLINLGNGINIPATQENLQLYSYLKQLVIMIMCKHQSGNFQISEIRRLINVLDSQLRVPNVVLGVDKLSIYSHILSILSTYCSTSENQQCFQTSQIPQNLQNSSNQVNIQNLQNQYKLQNLQNLQNPQNPQNPQNQICMQNIQNIQNIQNFHENNPTMRSNSNLANSHQYLNMDLNGNHISQQYINSGHISENQVYANDQIQGMYNRGVSQNQPTNYQETIPIAILQQRQQQQQRNYINLMNQNLQNVNNPQRLINIPPQSINLMNPVNQINQINQMNQLGQVNSMNYQYLNGMNMNKSMKPTINIGNNLNMDTNEYTNMNLNNNVPIPQQKIYQNCNNVGNINEFVAQSQNNIMNANQQQYGMYSTKGEIFEVGDNRSGRGNKIFIIPNNTQSYPINQQIVQHCPQKNRSVINIPHDAFDGHKINNDVKDIDQNTYNKIYLNNMEQCAPMNIPINSAMNAPMNAQMNPPINAQMNIPINSAINAPMNAQMNPSINAQMNAQMNAQINAQMNAPINAQMNAPMNAPINAQMNAPINAPINGQINATMNTPMNAQMNTPINAIGNNQNTGSVMKTQDSNDAECNQNNTNIDQNSSILWHKIQLQFESQIQQKIELYSFSENGFLAYQIKLKYQLEQMLKEKTNIFIENIPNFVQLITNPHVQRDIENNFLGRIKNGLYEVSFNMMDRLMVLTNLIAVNLLLCESKRLSFYGIIPCSSDSTPVHDGVNLNQLLVECDEILSTLIMACDERVDLGYCLIFYQHIFHKLRGCIQKRLCENRIVLYRNYNVTLSNNDFDIAALTKNYCELATILWNKSVLMADNIKPQLEFFDFFIPKLEIDSTFVYMSHYIYVVIFIAIYHSK